MRPERRAHLLRAPSSVRELCVLASERASERECAWPPHSGHSLSWLTPSEANAREPMASCHIASSDSNGTRAGATKEPSSLSSVEPPSAGESSSGGSGGGCTLQTFLLLFGSLYLSAAVSSLFRAALSSCALPLARVAARQHCCYGLQPECVHCGFGSCLDMCLCVLKSASVCASLASCIWQNTSSQS